MALLRAATALLVVAPILLFSCRSPNSGETGTAGRADRDLFGRLPLEDRQWTTRFDSHFRKYAKRFFGVGVDWRWFKAQGIAESGLRENATSWVGAQGVMQIMPVTLQEIADRTWIDDISEPKWNIAAGVSYDRHLYELWDDLPATELDRLAFTFASYNSGRRRTLQAHAQCRADDCGVWANVTAYAPAETRGYVGRIMELMGVAP